MFVVYDDSLRVLGKRLVFSPYGDGVVEASVSRDSMAVGGDTLSFRIAAEGVDGASLSVAVARDGASAKGGMGIVPRLFLSSEIRGGVPDADRFFSGGFHAGALDSLLCASVSDRYCVDSVLQGRYFKPLLPVETTCTARGRVVVPGVIERGAADATVNLISPQVDMLAIARADNDGRFAVPGLDYPDGTAYVVNAFTGNRREKTRVIMDEDEYPGVDAASMAVFFGYSAASNTFMGTADYGDAVLLKDVVVTATKRSVKRGTFSSLADFSLSAEDIDNIDATCIHEVLRRIPGIRLKGDKCYIRTGTSIYGDTPAAIAIDGVILDYNYDLDIINLHDIARIDIFKSGNSVIWGALGGAGVISVTTKNGNSIHDGAVVNRVSKYVPLGYQVPASEFVPDSLKNAEVIYWNGNLSMKGGVAHARFVVPKSLMGTRKYRVRVEGITDTGRLVSANVIF